MRGMGLNGKPALKSTALQGVPSLARVLTGVCVYVVCVVFLWNA